MRKHRPILADFPIFQENIEIKTWKKSLFNKYLLKTYYVPGFILCVGDTIVNKTDKNSAFMTLIFFWGENDKKK